MEEKNNINPNNEPEVLHTYAGDMADLVRRDEASVIKIAMAEQKRREAELSRKIARSQSRNSIIMFVMGIVLITLGVGVVNYLKQKAKEESIHPEVQSKVSTLIPIDNQKSIDASSIIGTEELADLLTLERIGESPFILSSLTLKTKSSSMSSAEFLELIGSSIPGNFQRTLDPLFTLGVYHKSKTAEGEVFIVFKFNSYEQAVAGAYAWEKTLIDEFYPLFGIDIRGENSTLLQKNFEDAIVENIDARVLLDNKKNPIMYSVFLNQKLFMVSSSRDAIVEAMKRLRTENAKPL